MDKTINQELYSRRLMSRRRRRGGRSNSPGYDLIDKVKKRETAKYPANVFNQRRDINDELLHGHTKIKIKYRATGCLQYAK